MYMLFICVYIVYQILMNEDVYNILCNFLVVIR